MGSRRRTSSIGRLCGAGAVLATTALLLAPHVLAAGGSPTTGAVFTTVNGAVDGTGLCQNGNPDINCNIYAGKEFVWLNGGPVSNGLKPDGQYFFAVLAPGGQMDPNDGSASNLSDDYDQYTNRTFTVTNGQVSGYAGTHNVGVPLIRLMPYANTHNPGGVYIMAVCSLANGYPVDPRSCKYDAFKVSGPDKTKPRCEVTGTGIDGSGRKFIEVTLGDAGGLESIQVVKAVRVSFTLPSFSVGSAATFVFRAIKTNQLQRSTLWITVRDVAGNERSCDPLLATVRAPSAAVAGPVRSTFRGVTRAEHRVTITNGRPGLRDIVLVVNGKRILVPRLAAGAQGTVDIASALRPGGRNVVTVLARGASRAEAFVVISD